MWAACGGSPDVREPGGGAGPIDGASGQLPATSPVPGDTDPPGDPRSLGDANGDGTVDENDLMAVASSLGRFAPDGLPADLNGDGAVDIRDLAVVAGNLGRVLSQPLVPMAVERAFPNLDFRRLTNLAQPDDGHSRIFVTEQPGRVRVFPDSQEAVEAQIFLDITDRVNEGGNEEGLLGLAFDPSFSASGHFYLYYSASNPRRSVPSRFSTDTGDPSRANPDSELVILEVSQPFSNHNGGQIAFGPDGFLYAALGDGGLAGDPLGNGQDPATLLGSILRIDVRDAHPGEPYRVPEGNPFVGDPDARPEVWAYGLRNPWRFSFDRATGRLWAADVGQNAWEEIDIIAPGLNYGWNIMEGAHCFEPPSSCDQQGLELPFWEYSHSEGCSITGGYVYRGWDLPSIIGAYVYADFCSGRIWGLRYADREVAEHALLVESGLGVASFGQDLAGNLYILSRDQGIYRLVPLEDG